MVPAFIVALFAHWVADFPVQAAFHRHMGKKATRLDHLLWHVLAYTTGLVLVAAVLYSTPFLTPLGGPVVLWAALNGVLHGVIDYWTSKATAHYWGHHVKAEPYFRVRFRNDSDKPIENVTASIEPSAGEGYECKAVWVKDNRYAGPFFTIIGFDQFLHVAFLLWSGYVMGVI